MKDLQMIFRTLEEVRVETLRRMENLTQEQLNTHPPQTKDKE